MRKKREMASNHEERGRMRPLRKTRRVDEGGKAAVMSGRESAKFEVDMDVPGKRAEMRRLAEGLWGRVREMSCSFIGQV